MLTPLTKHIATTTGVTRSNVARMTANLPQLVAHDLVCHGLNSTNDLYRHLSQINNKVTWVRVAADEWRININGVSSYCKSIDAMIELCEED